MFALGIPRARTSLACRNVLSTNGAAARFLRVPGGCYVEGGDWLRDRFQWKNALGRSSERPGHPNANWGYWSTDGVLHHRGHP